MSEHTQSGIAPKMENIRIVLDNTSHPGNIGGAARAMKNMCLENLYLVAPVDFPSGKARARASGALDVLERACVTDSLEEAVKDCVLVIGASARLRSIPWPMLDPRQCAHQVAESSRSAPVALVFGNETSGLSNEALEQCHFLVNIPANPEYSSLNLAAAVQVIAYELHMLLCEAEGQLQTGSEYQLDQEYAWATNQEMEGLFEHFREALAALDFYDPDNPRQLMRRLRRLFNRVRLDRMEINILRGMLSAAEDAVRHRNTSV